MQSVKQTDLPRAQGVVTPDNATFLRERRRRRTALSTARIAWTIIADAVFVVGRPRRFDKGVADIPIYPVDARARYFGCSRARPGAVGVLNEGGRTKGEKGMRERVLTSMSSFPLDAILTTSRWGGSSVLAEPRRVLRLPATRDAPRVHTLTLALVFGLSLNRTLKTQSRRTISPFVAHARTDRVQLNSDSVRTQKHAAPRELRREQLCHRERRSDAP